MNNCRAQVLDGNVWKTFGTLTANVENTQDMQRVAMELDSLARRYPDHRVRVVDSAGRLVDLR